MGAKWLELLKEIAPRVTRAAVLRDPAMPCRHRPVRRNPGRGAVARRGGDPGRCARRRAKSIAPSRHFARSPNGGLIVTGSPLAYVHRALIITLAARHRLPAVYFQRSFSPSGGLISYGPDPSTIIGAPPATSTASSRARSRPTCRSGADQIRAGDQSQDRQGARP